MNLLNYKSRFIYFLVGLHFLLAIYYSIRMPWGDDEWYTYNETTIMALPYQFIVCLFKHILGDVSLNNYIIYRQIGAFFIFTLYILLFRIRKESSYRDFSNICILFISTSAFVIFQEQYFRYYSFYLFVSFAFFYYQLKYLQEYKSRRLYFYILLFLSPMLHFFLTWQMVFYIIYQEFIGFSKSIKKIMLLITSICLLVLIIFWKQLMNIILPLAFGGLKAQGNELRGFSKNIVLKPFLYYIQYFFGNHITPNENLFVILLVIGLFISIFILIQFIYKNHKSIFWFITICGISPFILMFTLLEPLTLPGSTQFESKHASFFIPFILYIFSFLNKIKPFFRYILQGIFIACLIFGTYFSMGNIYPNWEKIKFVSNSSDYMITDGRANLSTAFYFNLDSVETYYNNVFQDKICSDNKSIFLVYNDYKSYQLLSKEQMWNTGSSSEIRNLRATTLLNQLRMNGFKATDSYTKYPFMCYRYVKTNQIHPLPWFYGYAYSDLDLPVTLDGDIILGWFPYQPGDSIYLNKSFYYMIECSNPNAETSRLELVKSDNSKVPLKFNNEHDQFRRYFCRSIPGYDRKVKEWNKRPLLSNSLAYPGSLMRSTGFIFEFNPMLNDKILVVKGNDIKLWVGVQK